MTAGYGFREVTNLSGGYMKPVSSGLPLVADSYYFVYGSYPSGSGKFAPTGVVYVYPRGDDPGYETTLAELAERGILLEG